MSRFSDIFATWNRVRVVIGFVMVAAITSIAISAWQMGSDNGGFLSDASLWDTKVCKGLPYTYFTPFRFSWKYPSDKAYNGPAYCPWSLNYSIFRLCLGGVTILSAIPLFWKNQFSELCGKYALFVAALLWYSAFVLDIAALVISTQMCAGSFGKVSTDLGAAIEAAHISIECQNGPYGITVGIDVFAFATSFLAWMAWSNCEDLFGGYGGGGGGGGRSSLAYDNWRNSGRSPAVVFGSSSPQPSPYAAAAAAAASSSSLQIDTSDRRHPAFPATNFTVDGAPAGAATSTTTTTFGRMRGL